MPTSIYCHGWLALADAPKKLTVRLEMFPQRLYGPEPPLYCPAFCNGTVSKPQLFKLSGDVQGVLFSSAEKAQKAIDEHREWLADVVKIDEEIDVGNPAPKSKLNAHFSRVRGDTLHMFHMAIRGANDKEIARATGKTTKNVRDCFWHHERACGLNREQMLIEFRSWETKNREGGTEA